MKKILAVIFAAIFVTSMFAACGKTDGGSSSSGSESTGSSASESQSESEAEQPTAGIDGTPSEIIDAIYEKSPVELMLGTIEVDLADADAVRAYTGLTDGSVIKEAAVSEPMMGSQAYSLVVVRVNDGVDVEATAQAMMDGIDTRKWICVMADTVNVEAKGDVIMLFMVEESLSDAVTPEAITGAFAEVCGGSVDVSLSK